MWCTQPAKSPTEKSVQRCGAERGWTCQGGWEDVKQERQASVIWNPPGINHNEKNMGQEYIFSILQDRVKMRPPSKSPSASFQQKSEPRAFLCNIRLFLYLVWGDIYLLVSPAIQQEMRSTVQPVDCKHDNKKLRAKKWPLALMPFCKDFTKMYFIIYGLHKPGKKISETIHF